MSSTITNLNAANLFVGDDDPTRSEFLTLKTVKLPKLTQSTKEHLGGGAAAKITLALANFTLDPLTFNLEGVNPHLIDRFMSPNRIKYTLRANLFDAQAQLNIPLVAVLEGKMTELDIGEFQSDQGVATAYSIQELVYYELKIDNTEKIYFNYFAGLAGLRINGRAPLADAAANIGLS